MARRPRRSRAATKPEPASQGDVSAPHGKTQMRKGGRINLPNVLAYLRSAKTETLLLVADAVTGKMADLGIAAGTVTLDVPEVEHVTGNVRGILKFIETSTTDDTEALQAIAAFSRR